MVEVLEGYFYSDRLRILGLTTLETRFLRADLIEVFKILRGFKNVDCEKFFQVVRDVGIEEGIASSCSREGTGWMLGAVQICESGVRGVERVV